MCGYVCTRECVLHVCGFSLRLEALDSLEVNLQVVVSCPSWVLGTKYRSSAKSPTVKKTDRVSSLAK